MLLHLLLIYAAIGLIFAVWRLNERLMAPSPDDGRMLALFAAELFAWPAVAYFARPIETVARG
jgi:hypothetical protein